MKRLIFGLAWVGLVVYAFFVAPADQTDTIVLIRKLATGNWQDINPIIIALFNAMGIWPMVYASVALFDGRGQKLSAWPFVVGSFAVGAFALLPYLALRRPTPQFIGLKSSLLSWLDSPWWGWLLTVGATITLGYGLMFGDWSDFWSQWQTSRFIHVMSLDFCLLGLLFPVLLIDDLARRELRQPWVIPAVLALPLVGACLYLALRPRLPGEELAGGEAAMERG